MDAEEEKKDHLPSLSIPNRRSPSTAEPRSGGHSPCSSAFGEGITLAHSVDWVAVHIRHASLPQHGRVLGLKLIQWWMHTPSEAVPWEVQTWVTRSPREKRRRVALDPVHDWGLEGEVGGFGEMRAC